MKKENPLIYLITEGSLNSQNYATKSAELLKLIEVASQSKVSMIQIREKNLTAGLLFKLTSQAVKITKNTETKILVNDRADVALAAKADGFHLTSNSISSQHIRQNFPKDFIIGVSAHSSAEVLKSKNEGADFAVFSPIFFTPNKGKPLGVEKLAEVVKLAEDFPILALGGINESNFASTLIAGAKGIAGISLFNDAAKLPEIVERINGEINE